MNTSTKLSTILVGKFHKRNLTSWAMVSSPLMCACKWFQTASGEMTATQKLDGAVHASQIETVWTLNRLCFTAPKLSDSSAHQRLESLSCILVYFLFLTSIKITYWAWCSVCKRNTWCWSRIILSYMAYSYIKNMIF